jgi:thiamine pyrophosphokinase
MRLYAALLYMPVKSPLNNPEAFPYSRDLLGRHHDALVMANGTPPSKSLVLELRKRSRKLLALDGGLNVLRRWRLAPDFVVGDFDSVSHASLTWAERLGTKIVTLASQEQSDIEKGLAFCRKNKLRRILLTGIEGDAIEHVLNAVSSVTSIRGLHITIVTRRAIVLVLRGRVSTNLTVPAGHTISWLACPEAGPCILRGVKWTIEGRMLRTGGFNSLSNLPEAGPIELRQQRGNSLLVINMRKQRRRTVKPSA